MVVGISKCLNLGYIGFLHSELYDSGSGYMPPISQVVQITHCEGSGSKRQNRDVL